MTDRLKIRYNRFRDAIVDHESLPADPNCIQAVFEDYRREWDNSQTNAVWLEIPSAKATLLPILYGIGFKNHHCTEDYITLTLWLGKLSGIV